jgi:hypothetical protein
LAVLLPKLALRLRLLDRRFLPCSFARVGQSLLARGLLGDHRRLKPYHMRDGIGRRRLRVQIAKVAKMEKTREAALAALRFGEVDIGRLVWIKERRHSSPCGDGVTQLVAGNFPLTFVGLAAHSTNLRVSPL